MITLFACPKPFQGHIDTIQRNALRSWTLLSPKPEIILLGADRGVAEICKEFGLVHIAEVDRNEYGTPLVSSVFQIGQARSSHSVVCYINSDIMLTNDFVPAIETVAAEMSMFLVLGQRTDIDIKDAWNFDAADWEGDLKRLLAQKGTLHPPSGIDFFCFPRGMYTNIPPFAIGRPGFDNWLVWRARSKHIPIVDITSAALIVHQNHESLYTIQKLIILEVGSMNTENESSRIKSLGNRLELTSEARLNIALVPEAQTLNIWAATWMIDRKGRLGRCRLTLTPAYLYYQLKCVARLYCPALYRMSHRIVSVAKALLPFGRAKTS